MASNFGDLEASNFELFRDCLSTPLIEKSLGEPQKKTKKRKSDKPNIGAITSVNNSAERNDDAAELGEFVDVSDMLELLRKSILKYDST